MKKLTDFIVDKRHVILVLFLVLTGLSIYTMQKVKLNYELSEYLPSSSETRQGMERMEREFDSENSSYLNLMFEGLNEEEKNSILENLKSITGVASVSYDDTEKHNKENFTYYEITVSDTEDSLTAKNVYETIKNNYEDYTLYMNGTIYERNGPILQTWIIALAIGCAMVILIIMCESYIEPFLFLFAIGLAVFLNKGTNIIFSSVSNITDSIVAILQMALSMDYSIMLMNRYSQEKESEKNKVKAMKKALYASFSSISSSSITTIVGMLALVFMSFTIGRDLGFVLAKGVLFSLISIFFCLPSLILMFDSLIGKTRKKVLSLKLDLLGKFANKIRYVAPILLIALFIGSYFLKGNLLIAYTSSEDDKIASVFPENNQVVVVYKNELEEQVASFCRGLNKTEALNAILCYGNTLNEDLTSQELKKKMSDLGTDVSISDEILKMVYFDYFNKSEITLSYEEFLNFIEKDILTNDAFKDKIDSSVKNNLKLLKNFTKEKEINKKRSVKEIATILGLDENTVNDLFVFYSSKTINNKMTISTFINFLNKDVLTNSSYASHVNKATQEQIKLLKPFLDKNVLKKESPSSVLAQLFGMDESQIKQLFLLKYSGEETNKAISIAQFIEDVLFLKKNTTYLNGVDTSLLESLKAFSQNEGNINTTKVPKNVLESFFGEPLVSQVYKALSLPDTTLLSPLEFITLTLNHLNAYLSDAQVQSLSLVKKVMEDALNQNPTYKASRMAMLFGMKKEQVIQIYTLTDYVQGKMDSYTMTPVNFVSFVLQNKEGIGLDKKAQEKLELLSKVCTSVLNNTSYSSKELSRLFGMDEETIRLLYALYSSKSKEVKVSLSNMVDFLLTDVVSHKTYSSFINKEAKSKLMSVKEIMNDSLKEKRFTSRVLTKNLSSLSEDLDSNTVSLVYTYYGSKKDYDSTWKMNVYSFVSFLNNDLIKDERFESFLTEDLKEDITNASDQVSEAKALLVGENYSRMILNTTYPEESEETFNFIKDIKETLNYEEIYVIGNSPMALEMSESFQSELSLITILTMLFIFIVVAFTFKSFIIPIVLVLLIQCAVYVTMGILSLMGGSVYFIALLIVQSILMGATIDYAILYTSYYLESRKSLDRKKALINAYNKSIHTILTSASILIIVTLIVGSFASAIAAKICKTLSEGTLCATLLILIVLPAVLAAFDKFIVKNKTK